MTTTIEDDGLNLDQLIDDNMIGGTDDFPAINRAGLIGDLRAALRSSPAVDGVGDRVTCPECNGDGCDGDEWPCPRCGGLRTIRSALSPTSDRASVVEAGSAGRPTEEEMERAYDRWCEMPSIMSTRDRLRLALTAALSPRSS